MEKNPGLIWLTTGGAVFLALAGLLVLFGFLYRFDNKYTAGPPYGREGLFSFKEEDLSKPLFLIDGWEFYPGELLGPEETSTDRLHLFVGQYSTFSKFTKDGSPFGAGTYRLTLTLDGSPRIMTLELPEIFTDYTLWADGQKIAARGSGTFVTFLMDRTVVLTLQTENHTHYYSGLTYPPILGTPDIMNRLSSIIYPDSVLLRTCHCSSDACPVFPNAVGSKKPGYPFLAFWPALPLFFGPKSSPIHLAAWPFRAFLVCLRGYSLVSGACSDSGCRLCGGRNL